MTNLSTARSEKRVKEVGDSKNSWFRSQPDNRPIFKRIRFSVLSVFCIFYSFDNCIDAAV